MLKYLFHRDHFIVIGIAVTLLFLLGVIAFNLDFLNPVANALDNFSVTDVFFDIQHSGSEPEECELVTLVDMTELHARGDIAMLLDEIGQNDPLFVGVDLFFEGEKDDPLGNELLQMAVSNLAGRSVFSEKLIDYDSSQGMFTNSVRSFFADEVDFQEAYTNLNDDMAASCIRDFSSRLVLQGRDILSFPVSIASRFDESAAQLDNDELLINFKNVRFPVVSYDDIAEKSDLIDGHIVLVGTMTEEQDMHNTPLGKMPGLELQAYSLLTLLEHKAIRNIPKWLTWLIAFLFCYILEITIDLLSRLVEKKKSPLFVFLKESNVVSILLLFFWVVFVCWLMFLCFVKKSLILSGGLILGLMALVCEGRDLYKSIIKALSVKYEGSSFIETSLLKDND